MKDEHGITLMLLVITIIILIILASVAISSGGDSLQTVKLENFSYELQQLQGKVDIIYQKIQSGDTSYYSLRQQYNNFKRCCSNIKNSKRN